MPNFQLHDKTNRHNQITDKNALSDKDAHDFAQPWSKVLFYGTMQFLKGLGTDVLKIFLWQESVWLHPRLSVFQVQGHYPKISDYMFLYKVWQD